MLKVILKSKHNKTPSKKDQRNTQNSADIYFSWILKWNSDITTWVRIIYSNYCTGPSYGDNLKFLG